MKKIALCGNIASGKSTVQEIIQKQGYKVLDTDDVAHRLLTINNKKLYENFKDYDVFKNGEFSRQKVARLIFNDEIEKNKIESIMHPQIENEINIFFNTYSGEKLLFVGIPLLFEAKMEKLFDKIIFIYADDDIRLKRLLKRNNYTLDHAKARISCQMPQKDKAGKSDFVINNNSSLENLKTAVLEVLKNLETT